jgi:hypothetical protein
VEVSVEQEPTRATIDDQIVIFTSHFRSFAMLVLVGSFHCLGHIGVFCIGDVVGVVC